MAVDTDSVFVRAQRSFRRDANCCRLSLQAPRSDDGAKLSVWGPGEGPGAATLGFVRLAASEEDVDGVCLPEVVSCATLFVGERDILSADEMIGVGRTSVFACAHTEKEGEDEAPPSSDGFGRAESGGRLIVGFQDGGIDRLGPMVDGTRPSHSIKGDSVLLRESD